jgi:hypothetical protein
MYTHTSHHGIHDIGAALVAFLNIALAQKGVRFHCSHECLLKALSAFRAFATTVSLAKPPLQLLLLLLLLSCLGSSIWPANATAGSYRCGSLLRQAVL